MLIRPEQTSDEAAINALVTAAFGQRQEADLVDALRASGDLSISLVAEDQGSLVGYVAFSRLKSPEEALAMAPVAVAPDRQRSGIGSAVIRMGLDRARELGCRTVFVLGEPTYYARFGFSTEDGSRFPSPYAGPYFMALTLSDALQTPAEVIYADAFSQLR